MIRGFQSKQDSYHITALTIHTTLDPDVTMFITCSTVAGVENTRVRLHIGIQVALVIPEDRARNRRPWRSQSKHSLNVVSRQLLRDVIRT